MRARRSRGRGPLDQDLGGPTSNDALDALADGLPVLVDLSGLRMLTSAGVHVLLKPRAFGRPAIFCPFGPVSKVLEIVHAHRLVPIYADLQAVLSSLTA